MKKAILLLCFGLCALGAAEFSYGSGPFSVTFDTKGGCIKKLMWQKKALVSPGNQSFTERVMANCMRDGKKAQMQECFDALEFRRIFHALGWRKLVLEFSARGAGAFDWMRLTKTYTYEHMARFFTLEYKMTNLDSVPHNAALWVRSFLRSCQNPQAANTYMQSTRKPYTHPGDAKSDEWMINPPVPATAVFSAADKFGSIVSVPPQFLDTFYNWFSTENYNSTVEFVTRDFMLAPGKSISFKIKVAFGDNIPQQMEKLLKAPVPAVKKQGSPLYTPEFHAAGKEVQLKTFQSQGGLTVKPSAKSMRLDVPRQFNNSVREILLPEKCDLSKLSLCEIANGAADDSRDVPFNIVDVKGRKILRFLVPGNPRCYLGLKKIPNQKVYTTYDGNYAGDVYYPVELRFDRAAKTKYTGPELKPNIFENGDFSKLRTNGQPEGWVTANDIWSRKWYTIKDGALHLNRFNEKQMWVKFYEYFAVEQNLKYHLSMRIRNDNKILGVAAGGIHFYDAKGKEIKNQLVNVYPGNKDNHGWKTLTADFYAPAGATHAYYGFVIYGVKDQTLSFDDIKLTPEPYTTVTVSLIDRLRDQLKSSWYKPLDLIERNSHAVVTPHKKWLKPAAFTMPEILFLPFVSGNYASLERRTIVELAQRMDICYTMIPLLHRVSYINGSGIMGVYGNTTLPELEPYTIERLKTAPDAKVILISGVNFKKHVKAPFINFLKSRKDKSSFLFLDCVAIPQEFLGTLQPTPPEFAVVPRMHNPSASQYRNFISFYKRGNQQSCVLNISSSAARRGDAAVPDFEMDNRYPGIFGRDFAYWEYEYLTLGKALRELAGVKPELQITAFKNGALTINAAKDGKAKIEITYETPFRETVAKTTEEIALKAGANTVAVGKALNYDGKVIAEVRLSVNGKIADAAGVLLRGKSKIAVKIDFPKGMTVPFGKAMPLEVSCKGAPEGAELSVIIEDAEFRQVAQKSVKGDKLSLSFDPKFPRTVLYRVLATVREKGKVVASQMKEMIFSGRNDDPKELVSVVWPAGSTLKYHIYKQLGIDHAIIWCCDNLGATRALRNLNMEPAVFGMGSTSFPNWIPYHSDKMTNDPVRNPCFSDAECWKKADANISKLAKRGRFTDYDVKFHFIGDELTLGSSVCWSPHCLRDFRALLKKQYGSIAKLNAAWGTKYASFDEAAPVHLKQLKDKAKLGSFVDHRLFMSELFANVYMGGIRKRLKACAPASVIGLSGTGNPGYSFNWALVMKHLDYLACYDGIQRQLVRDFANPGALIGQWYGGYVLPTPHEGYINSFFWRDLLQGGRLSPNYCPRAGITGDLLLTPQLKFYSDLVLESRRGIAKLVLNSVEQPKVAAVYSQSSLYAATATIGLSEFQNTLSGWHALLGDLGINYKFLYAPELPEKLDSSFKVLILPGAVSLSDAELKAIRKFAEKGGTVIADMGYGLYDEHGTLRSGKKVPKIVSKKFNGVDFRSIDGTAPVLKVEKVGKGSIVTMNLMLAGYQQIILTGTGGETAKEVSGSGKFCAALRDMVTKELGKAGVKRDRIITGKDGKMRQAETVWREFNGNALLGVWLFDRTVKKLNPAGGEDVTIQIPRKGYVYNVRTGKYIGFTDKIPCRIYAGGADLFAVLKEKAAKPAVKATSAVVRGEELKFSVKLGSTGRVFHCELVNPAGKVCYQRNLAAEKGNAEGSFQLALNDQPGVWTLRVKDTASSLENTVKVTVK